MEVSSQHYALATLLQENKCSTHRTEGWVGPRAGLDILRKRKNLLHVTGTELHTNQISK
jgi:hypothetical protein